ncbi:unnamed protein product [Gongylonema pulchrum]|uniref:WAPL domain-containing protein n=1 Tax=Gongylonema pulchrum TaxID=637853 RepID=A0A183E518_9BILA|nr:unnamed protein product [Gongylonema pulchrum]
MAVCISSVIYMLSRDTGSVPVDEDTLSMFNELLKLEEPNFNDEEYSKTTHTCMAVCISSVIYMLSRDTGSVPVDEDTLSMFNELLKLEEPNFNDEEYSKTTHTVMDILKDWLKKSFTSFDARNVQFDVTKMTLTPSFLMLESLVYITSRKRDKAVQVALRNTCILNGQTDTPITPCKNNESGYHVFVETPREMPPCARISMFLVEMFSMQYMDFGLPAV